MKKYRNYTDQDIIDKAKYVKSIRQLLIELDLKPAGGNYEHLKKNLARLNVDTKHWTGQAWNLDLRTKDFANYKVNSHLKKHLIYEKGHKCSKCGINEWRTKPIVMELNHIDGDRTNNEFDNLELLCPNCHSQTPNWRGRTSNIFTNDT